MTELGATKDKLQKRLRDCLRDSSALRAKAMRNSEGYRRYRYEPLGETVSQDKLASNESLSSCGASLIGNQILTADEKFSLILQRAQRSHFHNKQNQSDVEPSVLYDELPATYSTIHSKKRDVSIVCSLLLPYPAQKSHENQACSKAQNHMDNELLVFCDRFAAYRQDHDQYGNNLSGAAQVIHDSLRLSHFDSKSRYFWDECFATGLFAKVLEKSSLVDEYSSGQMTFFHANHVFLCVSFHHQLPSILDTKATHSVPMKRGEVSMVSRCLQHFTDHPESSVSSFLRSIMSAKEFRSYVEAYYQALLKNNILGVMDSEWFRIFHCIRAGRLDAALLYKAGFEEIELIMEHIQSITDMTVSEHWRKGSNEIAQMYHHELQKSNEDQCFDPFKSAVLLYFSGSSASSEDVRIGLKRLYNSQVFMTNQENFIWIALLFSDEIDMMFLVKYLSAKHPALNHKSPSFALNADPIVPEESLSNSVYFFKLYQQTLLDAMMHAGLDKEAVIFATFSMLITKDDPSLPCQDLAFWRKHLLDTLNNSIGRQDSANSLRSEDKESILIRSLRKAFCPIQAMLANILSGTRDVSVESYPLAYCVRVLGLFSTAQRCDLLVELYISECIGMMKWSKSDSIFANIDMNGIQTSKFFNFFMNYHGSSDDSEKASLEDRYRQKAEFIIQCAGKAKSRGFVHISVQLFLDAYVFLVQNKVLDAAMGKSLLKDIADLLMKEIQDRDYRNSFGIIDMAQLLRTCLQANTDLITSRMHSHFLIFLEAVGIHEGIYRAFRQQGSTIEDASFYLPSDLKGPLLRMEPSVLQGMLEHTVEKFEEVYRLLGQEENLLASNTPAAQAVRDSVSLVIRLLLALQDLTEAKICVRSHPYIHGSFTQFLTWVQSLPEHLQDEKMVEEIHMLSSEFLGQTSRL